jgi:uncharacterized RDD family membrane protein YckC
MNVIEPTEIIPPRGASFAGHAVSPYRGVLRSRVFAFLIDAVAIGTLSLIAFFVTMMAGVFTFGLAWVLLPAIWPLVALLYNGFTIAGPRAGTWGMRAAGIRLVHVDGAPLTFIAAAAHAVIFYVSVSVLTPFVLLLGLVRNDRRMLHDLLVGSVALRGPA